MRTLVTKQLCRQSSLGLSAKVRRRRLARPHQVGARWDGTDTWQVVVRALGVRSTRTSRCKQAGDAREVEATRQTLMDAKKRGQAPAGALRVDGDEEEVLVGREGVEASSMAAVAAWVGACFLGSIPNWATASRSHGSRRLAAG